MSMELTVGSTMTLFLEELTSEVVSLTLLIGPKDYFKAKFG